MKIGAVFPTTDIGDDPALLRDFAQAAEEIGYDHLILPDHVLGAVHAGRDRPLDGPYDENTPFHEPFVLFGYLAGVTSRIEFATGVLVLPQRQTALVAKQAVEVAILSGNRFRMVVGTGWNHVEYEALNESWSNRGKREEEQIEVIRRLWTEHVVDFDGQWHRIDRAGILPRASAPIPLWLGGYNEIVYRRAARLADGFLLPAVNREEAQRNVELLRRCVTDAGRDPATFGIEGGMTVHRDPDKWRSQVDTWRDLEVSHLVVRTMSRQGEVLPGIQDHFDKLEAFWQAANL